MSCNWSGKTEKDRPSTGAVQIYRFKKLMWSFFSTDALECNKTLTATGYGYGLNKSDTSVELPRMLELTRKPQDKDVYFEMHFAAKGDSDAHVVLSWKRHLIYNNDYEYPVYEISKT